MNFLLKWGHSIYKGLFHSRKGWKQKDLRGKEIHQFFCLVLKKVNPNPFFQLVADSKKDLATFGWFCFKWQHWQTPSPPQHRLWSSGKAMTVTGQVKFVTIKNGWFGGAAVQVPVRWIIATAKSWWEVGGWIVLDYLGGWKKIQLHIILIFLIH